MSKPESIKFVVPHFYPEVNALTNRLESLLPLLCNRLTVRVIYLQLPGTTTDEESMREKFGPGLELYPVMAKAYDRSRFLRRTLGEIQNNWRLWRRGRRVKADVLFQSIPQLMLLPVSLLFVPFDSSRRKILEIRDLTWEYLELGRSMPGQAAAWLVERIAVFSIARFDEVVTCTSGQADFVRRHTECPVTIVRNGIARARHEELASLPDKTDDDRLFRVCYFGTFGHAQNLLVVAKAARLLCDNHDIEFVLVGDGPDREKIEEVTARFALTNLRVVGKVPWSELLDYYAAADVLYAQLKAGDAFASAEPSKLFEYFSTGKPVIYGGQGLGAALAAEFENVTVIEPDAPEALGHAVSKLFDSRPCHCPGDVRRVEQNFVRERIFENYLREAELM